AAAEAGTRGADGAPGMGLRAAQWEDMLTPWHCRGSYARTITPQARFAHLYVALYALSPGSERAARLSTRDQLLESAWSGQRALRRWQTQRRKAIRGMLADASQAE